MTKKQFFESLMREEYPNAGFFRRWFELKRVNIWLKLKAVEGEGTNADFINGIPFQE